MRILLPNERQVVSECVFAHFGESLALIHSRSRKESIARPRQIVFYLLRQLTPTSFASIGNAFEKDPGTVKWGCDTIQDLIDSDPTFSREIEHLKNVCAERLKEAA